MDAGTLGSRKGGRAGVCSAGGTGIRKGGRLLVEVGGRKGGRVRADSAHSDVLLGWRKAGRREVGCWEGRRKGGRGGTDVSLEGAAGVPKGGSGEVGGRNGGKAGVPVGTRKGGRGGAEPADSAVELDPGHQEVSNLKFFRAVELGDDSPPSCGSMITSSSEVMDMVISRESISVE